MNEIYISTRDKPALAISEVNTINVSSLINYDANENEDAMKIEKTITLSSRL